MRRWRSKVTAIVVAAAMLASMVGLAAPAGATEVVACDGCTTGCGDWAEFDLFAGQDWLVGKVLVNNCDEHIMVKYVLDEAIVADGYGLSEVHLSIGDALTDIPQTKKFNPIPGQFLVNECFSPAVPEAGPYCFAMEEGWDADTDLIIAAHAVVSRPEIGHTEYHEFCVTSGVNTDVDTVAGLIDATVIPAGPWDPGMEEALNDADTDWIWDAAVSTSYYADNGGMVDFVQGFDIIGTPTSATLKIAADNAFAFSLNGGTETAANLTADWRTYAELGDFGYPYMVIDPDPTGWSQVYDYDVLGDILTGANMLNVTGVNADWDTISWSVNPAAVIYKLCGTSEQYVMDYPAVSESAWSAGTGFAGANWATYSTYNIRDWELVETITVPANSSGPISSGVLTDGKSYMVKASGVWKYVNWSPTLCTCGIDTPHMGYADAGYSHRIANSAYCSVRDEGWISGAFLTAPYQHYLELLIGDAPVDWGTFNADHVYTAPVTGDGSSLNFKILDNDYRDNVGSLTVEIYAWQ